MKYSEDPYGYSSRASWYMFDLLVLVEEEKEKRRVNLQSACNTDLRTTYLRYTYLPYLP